MLFTISCYGNRLSVMQYINGRAGMFLTRNLNMTSKGSSLGLLFLLVGVSVAVLQNRQRPPFPDCPDNDSCKTPPCPPDQQIYGIKRIDGTRNLCVGCKICSPLPPITAKPSQCKDPWECPAVRCRPPFVSRRQEYNYGRGQKCYGCPQCVYPGIGRPDGPITSHLCPQRPFVCPVTPCLNPTPREYYLPNGVGPCYGCDECPLPERPGPKLPEGIPLCPPCLRCIRPATATGMDCPPCENCP